MYATNYFEESFLKTMREIPFNAPETVYIGLYLTNPGEEGIGQEIKYDGYERQPIIFSKAAVNNGVVSIQNTMEVSFPKSNISAGTATHIGISDSKIGGNMLVYGKLDESLDVSELEAPMLMKGHIEVYSSGGLSIDYKKKFLNILCGESILGFKPFIALYNGDPDKGGSEIIAENYEREFVELKTPTVSATGQTLVTNNNEIIFNRPTTAWGIWNYTAIMDREQMGNVVWIYNTGISKELKKGYMPTAEPDALKFALN